MKITISHKVVKAYAKAIDSFDKAIGPVLGENKRLKAVKSFAKQRKQHYVEDTGIIRFENDELNEEIVINVNDKVLVKTIKATEVFMTAVALPVAQLGMTLDKITEKYSIQKEVETETVTVKVTTRVIDESEVPEEIRQAVRDLGFTSNDEDDDDIF